MKDLVTSIIKSGSSSFLVLALNLAGNKVLAITFGAAGVGEVSVIKQLYLFLASPAIGAQSALVQGIASKNRTKNEYISNSFYIFIIFLIAVSILIIYFADEISNKVFGNFDKENIILLRLTVLPTVLISANIFLKSIVNGFMKIGVMAISDILGALTLFFGILYLCSANKDIAIWYIFAVALSQLVMIAFQTFYIFKKIIIKSEIIIFKKPDYSCTKYFLNIAFASIVGGLASTFVILWVKLTVVDAGGYVDAGLFDLAWTVSSSYVMLILSSFSTYYMPKLTALIAEGLGDDLIRNVLRISVALMTPLIVFMIMAKPLLIELLYSENFLLAIPLMGWMLISDYLKITSWALGVPVIAKNNIKFYLLSEVSWSFGLFIILSSILKYDYNLTYIGIAIVIVYSCSCLNYLAYVFKNFRNSLTPQMLNEWVFGLAIILLASWLSWRDNNIPILSFIVVQTLSLLLSMKILSKFIKLRK
jgi:PST family polysaccharide transporter